MPANRYVNVCYDSNPDKSYMFRTLYTDLKQGDLVLTMTTRGPAVAIVISYQTETTVARQWVIGKCDRDAYEASQGATKHFCKVCGELLTELHAPCGKCARGTPLQSAVTDAMMIDGGDQ